MFGFSSFAQAPFAAPGGTAYEFAVAEDFQSSDTNTQISAFLQSQEEAFVASSVNSEAGLYFGSVIEDTGMADASTPQFGYTQSVSENLVPEADAEIQADFAIAQAEDITLLIDLSNTYFAFLQSITEGGTVAAYSTESSTFGHTVIENVAVGDTPVASAGFTFAKTEALSSGDFSEAVSTFVQDITEATTVDDLRSIISIFALAITENFAPADVPGDVTRQFYLSIAESITMRNPLAIQAAFQTAIAENIGLGDNQVVVNWAKILSDQPANWGNITDSQSGGWTLVNTPQSPSWIVIDDTA